MLKIDENEKLIKVFRKHSFYVYMEISVLFSFGLLPVLIFPFVNSFLTEEKAGLIFLLFSIYFLYLALLWVLIFTVWTNYYLDMWILTDKRLIDVEQKNIFSREVSSLRLDRIQDVKVEVVGFVDTMLNIGSVHVQTAGSEKEFVIFKAKEPDKIKELILAEHNKQIEGVKTVRLENQSTG